MGSSSFSLRDEFLLSTPGVRKTTVQSHETAMQSRKTTVQSHGTAMQFPKYDATDRRTSPREEAPFCQDEKLRFCRRGRDRLDRCFPKPGKKCVTVRHGHRGNHLYHPSPVLNQLLLIFSKASGLFPILQMGIIHISILGIIMIEKRSAAMKDVIIGRLPIMFEKPSCTFVLHVIILRIIHGVAHFISHCYNHQCQFTIAEPPQGVACQIDFNGPIRRIIADGIDSCL